MLSTGTRETKDSHFTRSVTPLAQLGRGNSNSTITLAMTMVTQLSNHFSACYSTVEPRQVELKGLGHHLTTVARKSKDFMAGMQ